jgi:hypothetical protein
MEILLSARPGVTNCAVPSEPRRGKVGQFQTGIAVPAILKMSTLPHLEIPSFKTFD